MRLLAGTSRGVFALDAVSEPPGGPQAARPVLESGGVRELAVIDGRVLAGTGAGLHASDDRGDTWRSVGLDDREVWQVRDGGDGSIYAATQPAGLFRSTDSGATWHEVESFASAPEAAQWCIPVDPPIEGRARALVIDAEDPRKL